MGEIRNKVMAHAEDIKGLLARRHALDIKVFGSVARAEDREDSDVDFLVEFGPGASILDQIHLELDLRALLDCDIDVIPVGSLKTRDAHLLAEAVSL
ncbi:MAG: nucleotidyltransferase domain-containing protein [Candidatus Nanopelagicales bacterium]|nr:nucleotidyltransferase domain-containing protein [Candidatus Nanopelagicales bacterium]